MEHFNRVNLLHVRQDTREKGFEFDGPAAAREASRLWQAELHDGRVVLLLGRRVAWAFGAADTYFEIQHLGTHADVYVLPHPSGINRWFNDRMNKQRIAEFMRGIVEQTR